MCHGYFYSTALYLKVDLWCKLPTRAYLKGNTLINLASALKWPFSVRDSEWVSGCMDCTVDIQKLSNITLPLYLDNLIFSKRSLYGHHSLSPPLILIPSLFSLSSSSVMQCSQSAIPFMSAWHVAALSVY